MSGHTGGGHPADGGPGPLRPSDPGAIGPYVLTGRLGEGGMGVVYVARAPDGAEVAVKVVRAGLASDPAFRARFRTEAEAAARVVGFCTARVLGGDPGGPAPYLVTEYVRGPSLEAAVRHGGPLPPGDVEGFGAGVAMALTAIHRAGIVHRDLKPSNVILSSTGPRVIDFGIARPQDPGTSHTRAGEVLGSPGWMAPEQLRQGPVTPATDVFAWAGLVLFAATGRPPFGDGPPAVVAYRVLSGVADPSSEHAPDLRGLPPRLGGLVRAALQPDPRWRPTAETLLSTLLDAVPPSVPPAAALAATLAGPAADRATATDPASHGPAADPWAGTTVAPGPTPPTRVAPPLPPTQVLPPGRAPVQSPGAPALPPPRSSVAPPPVPPPRSRRRRIVLPLVAVAAVLLVGGALGNRDGATPGPGERRSPGAGAASGAAAPGTPAPTRSRPSAPARPVAVRDGDVIFTVRRLRCGVQRIGSGLLTYRAKEGEQMCLVDVRMRNVGRSAHLLPEQRLELDDGTLRSANAWLSINLRQSGIQFTVLQPGATLSGTLVFEVPAGARPARIDLRGDVLSSGTRRRVAG